MGKRFTSDNFETEVLKADKPVLVDFYADWCVPCRMLAPVVEQLEEEMAGDLVVGKLNVDENSDIAATYKVMSIPTLILFKDGKEAGKLVGMQSKQDVVKMIQG